MTTALLHINEALMNYTERAETLTTLPSIECKRNEQRYYVILDSGTLCAVILMLRTI